MLAEPTCSVALASERELRRQIDRSVSRALTDGDYAKLLLSDPTVVLEDHGCAPQQYKALRSIHAGSLLDFARQARDLFWIVEPQPYAREERRPLLAAAAH